MCNWQIKVSECRTTDCHHIISEKEFRKSQCRLYSNAVARDKKAMKKNPLYQPPPYDLNSCREPSERVIWKPSQKEIVNSDVKSAQTCSCCKYIKQVMRDVTFEKLNVARRNYLQSNPLPGLCYDDGSGRVFSRKAPTQFGAQGYSSNVGSAFPQSGGLASYSDQTGRQASWMSASSAGESATTISTTASESSYASVVSAQAPPAEEYPWRLFPRRQQAAGSASSTIREPTIYQSDDRQLSQVRRPVPRPPARQDTLRAPQDQQFLRSPTFRPESRLQSPIFRPESRQPASPIFTPDSPARRAIRSPTFRPESRNVRSPTFTPQSPPEYAARTREPQTTSRFRPWTPQPPQRNSRRRPREEDSDDDE